MMWELWVEPWTIGDWMWRGVLAACLAAVPCALLGVFLYLRRMSLIADALTHVALPGIVAAFLLSGSMEPAPMLVGAAAVGLMASVAIEGLAGRGGVRADASIGIVFTTFFAAGIIALSVFVEDAHIDTQCMLFGDVLGISDESLWLLGLCAPLVCGAVALGYRWLALVSFDEGLARNLGVPVALVHYGLMGAVSMTTVASFEAVGAILAIAMIVVPAATAHVLCDRLPSMLAVAAGHGVISALMGMYAAVWWDVSAAGAIVCVGGLLYALAFGFGPRHGVIVRWARRRRQRRRGSREPGPEPERAAAPAVAPGGEALGR